MKQNPTLAFGFLLLTFIRQNRQDEILNCSLCLGVFGLWLPNFCLDALPFGVVTSYPQGCLPVKTQVGLLPHRSSRNKDMTDMHVCSFSWPTSCAALHNEL